MKAVWGTGFQLPLYAEKVPGRPGSNGFGASIQKFGVFSGAEMVEVFGVGSARLGPKSSPLPGGRFPL
jgi:hypothetical protein